MISHYGLFWSERDVFWGYPGKAGELLGREKALLERRGAPTLDERQSFKNYRAYIGLYCLYGAGELLYVGEAGLSTKRTIFDRINDHRKGALAGRWDHFSWFGNTSKGGNTKVTTALAQLEAVTIAIINPGFNKQGGAFDEAIQVFQVPHDLAEGDMETKLDRLTEEFSNIDELGKTLKQLVSQVARIQGRS